MNVYVSRILYMEHTRTIHHICRCSHTHTQTDTNKQTHKHVSKSNDRSLYMQCIYCVCVYTAPRVQHAPLIIQPRTSWWTRRQLLANLFLRPLVKMGYNYWVPILVLTGRWPRANCTSAVVQLDQLGVGLYLSTLW